MTDTTVLDPSELLSGIPPGLRDPLLSEYRSITSAYVRGGWKLTSLDAGRFCEIVFSILEGALTGTYPSEPRKPPRFVDACRALENRPRVSVGDYSRRLRIPRGLAGIYEIRNNRNVGHVGGDVVANKMDALFVRESTSWVLCELVRVFHAISTAEAQRAVDTLTDRQRPLVWEHEGIRRVLKPEMPAADRTLLLLYGLTSWCDVSTLAGWVKYKNNFRGQILNGLGDEAMIEFDPKGDRVVITPRGAARAE